MRFWLRLGSNAPATDAHRDAGGAAFTGRAIGDGLAAAKAGMGQRLAQGLGQVAAQPREHLALGLARQIGAGPARRQEELRYACVALVGHG